MKLNLYRIEWRNEFMKNSLKIYEWKQSMIILRFTEKILSKTCIRLGFKIVIRKKEFSLDFIGGSLRNKSNLMKCFHYFYNIFVEMEMFIISDWGDKSRRGKKSDCHWLEVKRSKAKTINLFSGRKKLALFIRRKI